MHSYLWIEQTNNWEDGEGEEEELNKQQEIELEYFIYSQLVYLVSIQQFPVFCVPFVNLINVNSEGERN